MMSLSNTILEIFKTSRMFLRLDDFFVYSIILWKTNYIGTSYSSPFLNHQVNLSKIRQRKHIILYSIKLNTEEELFKSILVCKLNAYFLATCLLGKTRSQSGHSCKPLLIVIMLLKNLITMRRISD